MAIAVSGISVCATFGRTASVWCTQCSQCRVLYLSPRVYEAKYTELHWLHWSWPDPFTRGPQRWHSAHPRFAEL